MIKFIDALPEIKRAALEKARQAGFNENSMAEVSMGYIQARTSAENLNDKVLEAVSQLDAYQQFQFLQHLAGIVGETKSNQFNDNSNMSIWSDMEDRSAGETIRDEDKIRDKEQLAEALKRITEQHGNSDVLSGKLIEVMKMIADKNDIELLKIEVVTQ